MKLPLQVSLRPCLRFVALVTFGALSQSPSFAQPPIPSQTEERKSSQMILAEVKDYLRWCAGCSEVRSLTGVIFLRIEHYNDRGEHLAELSELVLVEREDVDEEVLKTFLEAKKVRMPLSLPRALLEPISGADFDMMIQNPDRAPPERTRVWRLRPGEGKMLQLRYLMPETPAGSAAAATMLLVAEASAGSLRTINLRERDAPPACRKLFDPKTR